MKNIKSDKGVTIVSLLTAVVIMSILATVSTALTIDYIDNIKLRKFNSELQIITDRTKVISKKIETGNDSYLELGKEITTDQQTFLNKLGFTNNASDFKLFNKSDLELIDISGIEQSVYINFFTGQVVSKDGINIDGTTYYMLEK